MHEEAKAPMIWTYLALVAVLLAVTTGFVRHQKHEHNTCSCGRDTSATPHRVADTDPTHYPYEVVFYIGNMHCGKCKVLVENALNSIDGVWAVVDSADETAHVRMKHQVKKTVLDRVMTDAGFRILKTTSVES